MPQMMPLSWLTLFIVFSTTLILFNTMNYYSQTPLTKKKKNKKIKTSKLNWKW
uniref:ATP synthase complex subunit 8 n=1 Tax=Glyptotermes sp. 11 AB-2022a TaxID=2942717 RepID=A0A8X8M285_9NEOP|nr:ATP synthase F0 subunit 8 [Glyptotermes sp. 11 AB-2022a]